MHLCITVPQMWKLKRILRAIYTVPFWFSLLLAFAKKDPSRCVFRLKLFGVPSQQNESRIGGSFRLSVLIFNIALPRPQARNQRLLIRFSCTRHSHGMSTRLCVDFGLILLFLAVIAGETKAQNEEGWFAKDEAYHKGLIFFSHFSLCGPLRLSAAAERCLKGRQFVVDWLCSLGCDEKK